MNLESYQSLGYQQLSSPAAATALTVPAGTLFCVFNGEVQAARWRDDGVDPTAAIGMLLKVADPTYPYFGQIARLKFIQVTAGAVINVTYYGQRA
jgi:hypothetical protein